MAPYLYLSVLHKIYLGKIFWNEEMEQMKSIIFSAFCNYKEDVCLSAIKKLNMTFASFRKSINKTNPVNPLYSLHPLILCIFMHCVNEEHVSSPHERKYHLFSDQFKGGNKK